MHRMLEGLVKELKEVSATITHRLTSREETGIVRPSKFLLFSEPGRALSELGFYFLNSPFLKRKYRGDGHPVLVLPGFLTSDSSTGILRNFLRDINYTPHGWGLGRNIGGRQFIDPLFDLVTKLFREHNEQVSLIGWSLGGVYARQIAKAFPEGVRQVITLGSPFGGIHEPNNAIWIYNRISEEGGIEEVEPELIEDLSNPPPVPTTAIYTKGDGIVSWKVCVEKEENSFIQNIQVHGSHCGLGVSVPVLHIIADRLIYDQNTWIPFEPKGKFEKMFYYPGL
jgi:pimeloyl-ACP methyl ester carboxylesterase